MRTASLESFPKLAEARDGVKIRTLADISQAVEDNLPHTSTGAVTNHRDLGTVVESNGWDRHGANESASD